MCHAGVVQVAEPKWVEIPDTRTSTYLRQLRECVEMKPNMIVVVIPNETGDAYASIKKLLCCECPVPSQILTVKKVIQRQDKHLTFATKILVQMTTKLGAQPWVLPIPIKGLMVVGFDTYHDTANKGQSFGALVASINTNCTKYFSACSPHVPKAEMSSQIPVLFTQALRKYKEINKEYPKRIFFYRDGVGEGQVKQVFDHELKKIQQIIGGCEEDEKPKLTFIIVSKRINTRFFAPMSQGPKPFLNPPSGTVVDDVVTLPERFDFFLISQSVRQGTVNPTSYNVICDESGLKPEHIQKLTYKLCHLYYNWTGTVRVPAPCQYAHKLAFLCGESLHNAPSGHLDQLLYFL
jgi:aubergine-like protein